MISIGDKVVRLLVHSGQPVIQLPATVLPRWIERNVLEHNTDGWDHVRRQDIIKIALQRFDVAPENGRELLESYLSMWFCR